jgi:surface protein
MFYDCSSLESLPDISKLNTDKINNMNGLFYGFSSLKSLPDISIWNTCNITDCGCMFYDLRCKGNKKM